MAAKNEEQRQTELKKQHDYSRPHNSYSNKGHYDKSTKDKSHKSSQHSKTLTGSNSGHVSGSGSSNTARYQQHCYLCNQPGYLAKYCKQSKTKESQVTTNPTEANSVACSLVIDSNSVHTTVRVRKQKGSWITGSTYIPQYVSMQYPSRA